MKCCQVRQGVVSAVSGGGKEGGTDVLGRRVRHFSLCGGRGRARVVARVLPVVPCVPADYLSFTASPADTTRAVVVVPGKYQRQLPAEVAVTLVVTFPEVPVRTVFTVR